jgi:predicted dehydrogenase
MKKVRWGILSTARIGREKVIPAMQSGEYCDIIAIASRDINHARSEAERLNIPKSYGSYEELLADGDIDAVYIPVPNDLHVPWAIKALEANKHVLCEKPIALSVEEANKLLMEASARPHLKVMEAFMYRFHPQWQTALTLVKDGKIGTLRSVQSSFSYYNVNPDNIRNKKEAGGGGMLDIGCYCISISRFIFNKEPEKVFGIVEYDQKLQTDIMASGILDFATGTSTFTVSTQLMPYQRVNILGTEGRIEIEIPFNAPPDKQTRMWLNTKNGAEEIVFEPVDQYTLQGDHFSKAILDNTPVPTDLQDAVNNMAVIDAIFESAKQGQWIKPMTVSASN